MACIEDFVPKSLVLRDTAKAIDFSFIHDKVKELYSADSGKSSLRPMVLFEIICTVVNDDSCLHLYYTRSGALSFKYI